MCVFREAARAGRKGEKLVQQEKEGMQERRRITREKKQKSQYRKHRQGGMTRCFYGGL